MRRVLAATLLVLASWCGAQERAIDKEVQVPAPIAEVWEAWTTREGIVSFFAPDAEIDARAGGAFHVHFDPLAAPGSKGADGMRYMALQKPSMLSFEWNAPPHLPLVRAQRTLVIVRLKDVDGRSTRVSLHHVGWGEGGEWDQTFAYFDRAWGNVLANLRKRFESGPVDWSDWMARLRKMHEQPAAR